MVSQHNSNWNQSHYSRLDWINWICHEKSQENLSQPLAGSANALFGKTQFFLRHPVLKTFEVKGVLLSVCICWSVAELA